jgi:autotransporter-associated beta strand protein
MTKRAMVSGVVVLAVASAQWAPASSGTWTGTANAAWTNSANWSGSSYPGSGTGQTATFNTAGNGQTVIDLLGLPSVKYLTFASSEVAAFTIGAGGPNSQTLVLEKNTGNIQLGSDAANGQTVDAAILLGTDAAMGTYEFKNGSAGQTLTFAGAVSGAASGGIPGTKTLTVSGAGNTLISGNISDGGANPVKLASYCTGTLTLAGSNTFNGDLELYSGALRLTHPNALSGAGRVLIRSPEPNGALIELAHDGTDETPFRAAIGVGNTGTLVSGVGTGSVGMNHTLSELGLSEVTLNFTRAAGVVSGSPSITVRSVILNANGTYTSTLNPTTADVLVGDVTIPSGSYRKVLVLDGTSAGNRVDGVISNGLNMLSVVKSNSGTWTLSGENVYTGATSVIGGMLVLGGPDGALKNTLGITVAANATLRLDNTAHNNSDRLGNTVPVTLAGGTLEYVPAAGAANTSETAGALVVSSGSSTVASGQAASGQTSALTFQALAYTGGTVNFEGEGLGEGGRNQILFATPPALSGGIIGPWATVNGTALATYGANGVTAYTGYTELSAKGPSVVPNDAGTHARISSEGTEGGISLEAADNSVLTLSQGSAFEATVSTAGKTLRTSALYVQAGSAALTVGGAADEGAVSALTAGGNLLLVSQAAAPLTVNAAAVDNATPSSLTKSGSGPVVLKGSLLHTGVTTIESGELVFGGHALPQTVNSAIGGAGSLGKSGTNLLHLLAANTYTGPSYINAGLVRPNQNTTFGTFAGGVFIADGATLDLGCTPDVGGTRIKDGLNLGAEPFYVCGAGAEGKGVIVNVSTTSQFNAFGRIALTGNATFGGTGDWRLQNNTPTLTLNGHTLTKAGTNMFDLYSANVIPGSGQINVAEGIFRLLYNANLGGSAANTVTVQGGSELNLYRLANPQDWTLTLEDGATVSIGSSTNAAHNRWAGPVTLNGAATLTGGNSGYVADIQGLISGTGSITKAGSATITLSGTNSTYTGSTRIMAGRLVVTSLRNVGEASSLGQPADAASGAIIIGSGTTTGSSLDYAGTGDTTDRAITMGGTSGGATLYHNGTGPLKFTRDLEVAATGSKNLVFRGDSPAPAEFAGNLSNVGGNLIAVTKSDAGSWTLSGTNSFTGTLTVDGGTLLLSGSNTLANAVTVNAGTLLLSGTNTFANTVTVNGGALQVDGTLEQGSQSCYVSGTTGGNGVLRLTDGAFMTGSGNLSVGRTSGDGAFYMTGGTVVRNTIADDTERFAFGFYTNGFGYLHLSGGELMATRFQLGHTSGTGASYGIARMTGGVFKCPGSIRTTGNIGTFHIGRYTGAVGVLTLDGGVLDHTEAVTFIQMGYQGGRAELNLTGGSFLNGTQTIKVRHSSGNSTGIVNVCEGELSLKAFEIGSAGVAWLNLQGGTLKATADTSVFVPSAWTGVRSFGPRGAFVGGAVIDTDGFTVTVPKPIEAPVGNGVTAINLSSQGSGYIGEPYVSITGGGGFGAAAIANMADDGTGNGTYKVASVTVTSPGVGYTSEPVVTLLRGGKGLVTSTVASVTLAPNTSGGLTKQGNGTLTLSATNTYTGATTVAGGTLRLTNAKALPTLTPVVLAGGTLDLNGYTVTNAVSGSGTLLSGTLQTDFSPAGAGVVGTNTFTLTGGATLRATAYLADADAQGNSDRVDVSGNIDLTGATLTLVDPNRLDRHQQYTLLTCTGTLAGKMTATNLPDSRWHLAYQTDGTVKLMFVDGTLIKVR